MADPIVLPRDQHTLSRRDIDPDALKVRYRLHQAGHVAYLVGGSVRDLLLGRRPKDFDVGTTAHPYQVKKRFRLPADLSGCTGIFVVGGFGAGGVNISDADLSRLNSYMDAGGDIYVGGSRLGEYMDPLLGAGNPTEQGFWMRFGCAFTPGAASGNMAAWDTGGNPFIGTHLFDYDPGPPDQYTGELTPLGNSAYLGRDSGGKVRATARRAVSGSSTRMMSTVLLGGSTGVSGSTREAFLSDVLTLFGTNLAALSVSRATVTVGCRPVRW